MKFISVVTIVALASAFLVQTQAQCLPASCPCTGHKAGLMCGDESTDFKCANGDVYQCNANGNTCTFGHRDNCSKCGKPTC